MTEFKFKVGTRVELVGKNVAGTVAFIGSTQFSTGKWIGVILDEPKGKNNGTVQGKRYFTCEEDHGIFVRPTQLKLEGADDPGLMASSVLSESSILSDSGSSGSPSKLTKTFHEGSTSSLITEPGQPSPSKGTEKMSLSSSRERIPVPQTLGDRTGSALRQLGPRKMSGLTALSDSRRSSISEKPPGPSTTSPLDMSKFAGSPRPTIAPIHDVSAQLIYPAQTTKLPTKFDSSTGTALNTEPSTELPPTTTITTQKPREYSPPRFTVDGGDGVHSPDTELELSNLRAEVKLLTEQLETFRTKREEDRQRWQELERFRIQLEQLETNRSLMREQAAELQRQLAQSKTEKAEVQEAFDRYREEMSDLIENMEMATLDKEMAEEKLDTLTSELELLKEQVEELTLENQILKEEHTVATPSTDGGPSPQQLKNLEQQNERMKQVLIRLRDLSNQDKQEVTRLTKEIASLESEVGHLTTEKDRLAAELKQSLEQTIELKEQVDAALGADQMVSQLTQRNLELEEQLEKLTEERNDLEALCEMNDELQENSRDTERELREEIEVGRAQINQLVRHLDALKETNVDYEKTVGKFRDLVTELQAQNADLCRSLADGKRQREELQHSTLHSTGFMPQASLSVGHGLASPSQTPAKMLEIELLRIEVDRTNAHLGRLTAFLPDSFTRRGGDNDALLALLLIDRFAARTSHLASHLSERYPLPSCIPGQARPQPALASVGHPPEVSFESPSSNVGDIRLPGSGQPLPPMTKNKAEFYSMITNLIFMLRCWSSLLTYYKQVLSTCSVELYFKIGSLYSEMAAHEATIDRLLDLVAKDQLDENISLEPLASSLDYFIQLRSVHMATEPTRDCSSKLLTFVQCVLAGVDALVTDATALMILTGQSLDPLEQTAAAATASVGGPVGLSIQTSLERTPAQAVGGLVGLLDDVLFFSTVTRITARRIPRRIPKDSSVQPLSFGPEVVTNLDRALSLLTGLTSALRETTRKAGSLAAQQDESSYLNPNTVFSRCLSEAFKEKWMSPGATSPTQPDDCIREGLAQIRHLVAEISVAVENGEYDFDGNKLPKPQEPCALRAAAHKQAQVDLEGCRVKLEGKEEEIRELQLSLKTKVSELSEMSVRVSLAEKRLDNVGKGSEEKVSRLEQRVEQLESQQKRKDSEHEQAIDALQSDVEVLEQEKAELKEKLKSLSKKALFEGLIKAPIAAAMSPVRQPTPSSHTVGTAATPGTASARAASRDSTFLALEIEALREAVRQLSADNSKLRGEKMLFQMRSLKPLKRSLLRVPHVGGARGVAATTDLNGTKTHLSKTNPLSDVDRQIAHLQKQIYAVLAHPKLVLLPQAEQKHAITQPCGAGDGSGPVATVRPMPSATSQLLHQISHIARLHEDLERLRKLSKDTIVEQFPHALIHSDFARFPSARLRQILTPLEHPMESDRLVSRLVFPGAADQAHPSRLVLSSTQLRALQAHLLSFG